MVHLNPHSFSSFFKRSCNIDSLRQIEFSQENKSKPGLGAVTKSAFCLCEKHYIRFFLENIVAK